MAQLLLVAWMGVSWGYVGTEAKSGALTVPLASNTLTLVDSAAGGLQAVGSIRNARAFSDALSAPDVARLQ